MKILIQFIITTLILQDIIAVHLPIFGYEDEFLMVIMFIYVIYILLRNNCKLSKYEIFSLILLIIYIVLGVISNINSGLIPYNLYILSIVMTIKGYLLYFEFRIIFQHLDINIEILKPICNILEIIMIILVLCLIGNYKLNFLEVQDVRFGVETYKLGFSHPTELAFFSIISMSLILFYNSFSNNNKNNNWVIFITFILVFFSGRSKAMAFIAIFIILFNFVKITKKFKIKYLIIIMPVAIYIALPRIVSELLDGARGYLYTTSIKIATDYFPLGSGFGTFGSYISRINYSDLYFRYGLSNIWGLSPSMPLYISDTYWAMILGECGFIGFILIVLFLSFIFLQFLKFKISYKKKIIIVGLLLYTIIASIAEPIYSSNKCAALFVVLAFFSTVIRKSSLESGGN